MTAMPEFSRLSDFMDSFVIRATPGEKEKASSAFDVARWGMQHRESRRSTSNR